MNLLLPSFYKELLTNPAKAFVQDFHGELVLLEKHIWLSKPIWQIHIYPGSFTQLTEENKLIFSKMPKVETIRLYEFSIKKADQESLTLEELQERLKQFRGYGNVLITNSTKLIEKAGLLRGQPTTYFHVEAEFFNKILQRHSFLEVQGLHCQFLVHDSNPSVKISEVIPSNCRKANIVL